MRHWERWVIAALLGVVLLVACGAPSNSAFERRNEALGGGAATKVNYYEAQQINQIEVWKDKPHIVYWYWETSAGIKEWACIGVPTSWTESLEPNHGQAVTSNGGSAGVIAYNYVYDIGEQYPVSTDELSGKDGTFGDPNPSGLGCMTVEGFPVFSTGYGQTFMSPVALSFPKQELSTDLAQEALKLQAEKLIQDGKCINPQALAEGQIQVIACPDGYEAIRSQGAPAPAPAPATAPVAPTQEGQ